MDSQEVKRQNKAKKRAQREEVKSDGYMRVKSFKKIAVDMQEF